MIRIFGSSRLGQVLVQEQARRARYRGPEFVWDGPSDILEYTDFLLSI